MLADWIVEAGVEETTEELSYWEEVLSLVELKTASEELTELLVEEIWLERDEEAEATSASMADDTSELDATSVTELALDSTEELATGATVELDTGSTEELTIAWLEDVATGSVEERA